MAVATPAATPSRNCVTSTDRSAQSASTLPVWRVRSGALGPSSAALSTPCAASISVYRATPSGAGSCTSRASRHCSTIRSVAHLSVHGPHVSSVLTHRQSLWGWLLSRRLLGVQQVLTGCLEGLRCKAACQLLTWESAGEAWGLATQAGRSIN